MCRSRSPWRNQAAVYEAPQQPLTASAAPASLVVGQDQWHMAPLGKQMTQGECVSVPWPHSFCFKHTQAPQLSWSYSRGGTLYSSVFCGSASAAGKQPNGWLVGLCGPSGSSIWHFISSIETEEKNKGALLCKILLTIFFFKMLMRVSISSRRSNPIVYLVLLQLAPVC